MAYRFNSHLSNFKNQLSRFFPFLFLVQIPEGLLTLVQKFSDSHLTDSPKIAFLLLYPLFSICAAVCSALNFLIVRRQDSSSPTFLELWVPLSQSLKPLILSSLAIGLLMIPATLAMVIPGVYVLAIYLFVPFLILESPGFALSVYFFKSKTLSRKHFVISWASAASSFLLSLLSYLGFSALDQLTPQSTIASLSLNSQFGTSLEIVIGIVLSVFLNTWISTLFLEVSAHEPTSN